MRVLRTACTVAPQRRGNEAYKLIKHWQNREHPNRQLFVPVGISPKFSRVLSLNILPKSSFLSVRVKLLLVNHPIIMQKRMEFSLHPAWSRRAIWRRVIFPFPATQHVAHWQNMTRNVKHIYNLVSKLICTAPGGYFIKKTSIHTEKHKWGHQYHQYEVHVYTSGWSS